MTLEAVHPDDYATVRQIYLDAFPSAAEADLVERLRRDGDAVIEMNAMVEGGRLVGCLMLSKMTAPFRALGLGPVAVIAERRRQGVATGLIQAAISRAKRAGWEGIFVLGDPAFYQRFGFSAQAAAGFTSPYAGPHFMLLAMSDKGLPVKSGRAGYAAAFAALG